MTAIDDEWQEHPWLGAPVDEGAGSEEMAMPAGRGWSPLRERRHLLDPEHGAHEMDGDIRVNWAFVSSRISSTSTNR